MIAETSYLKILFIGESWHIHMIHSKVIRQFYIK